MILKNQSRLLTGIALAAALAMGCTSTQQGDTAMNKEISFNASEQVQPATSVLRNYEAALNKADVATIVSLYAPDAVFMAQHRSPAVGHAQIESAYREIFGMIKLDISFKIDEVVVVSPTVAYARTRSAGTTTIVANDAKVKEGNQELFVLVRENDTSDWRISRYIFSTTEPRS